MRCPGVICEPAVPALTLLLLANAVPRESR